MLFKQLEKFLSNLVFGKGIGVYDIFLALYCAFLLGCNEQYLGEIIGVF